MIFFPLRFDRFHERRRALRSVSSPISDDTKSDEPLYVQASDLVVDKRPACEGHTSVALTESHLRSWQSRDQLIQCITRLLSDPEIQVLHVDMSEIRWLDGESLAQFARAHCNASQMGKQIILENVCDAVREIFHVTRFDRLVGLVDEQSPSERTQWESKAASLTYGGR